jgi:hypothetical protein
VYQYSNFSLQLRTKVVLILEDVFICLPRENLCRTVLNVLYHEYGAFTLSSGHKKNTNWYETNEHENEDELTDFFINVQHTEKALDVVELIFSFIEHYISDSDGKYNDRLREVFPLACEELNARFKEEGFGYQYESGYIIKMTSEYTHNEIVKPALQLLSDKRFVGAQEEFLSAHQHYRNGRNEESITDCLKAFESTMKIICKAKKIGYNESDTAKKLLDALYKQNYIPPYLQSQCTALQTVLESGVPTIRNKTGAHGQGDVVRVVDNALTELALNLTASNIVFLASLLDKRAK